MRIVLKIGGSLDGEGGAELLQALQHARELGMEVILVHGGGPEISRRLAERRLELPFIDGLRLTTEAAIPVVVEALTVCNQRLMEQLQAGGAAVQSFAEPCCIYGQSLKGSRTGEVVRVAHEPLLAACANGNIPLLPPFGLDAKGGYLNLNADTVAAHVAASTAAEKLIFCTDVAGVYADFAAGAQLFDVTQAELQDYMARGAFGQGMLPKVRAMLYAAEHGMKEIWVVDGHDGASISFAIQSAGELDQDRARFGTRLVAKTLQSEVQK